MHDLDTLKKLNRTAVYGPCPDLALEQSDADVDAVIREMNDARYHKRREAERKAGLRDWDQIDPWGPCSDWPRIY